jgi:hypothetical protein
MEKKVNSDVIFLSLAFNHDKYIIEHLESIKFLVIKYGEKLRCSLIINDDCSKDNTVSLIELWLKQNSDIFFSVVKLYNKVNIGTSASLIKMLKYTDSSFIKITGADDVYSYENIFAYKDFNKSTSILSGYPLLIREGRLSHSLLETFTISLSETIYRGNRLIERFKFLSNNNAPNIIYNPLYLKNKKVLKFLKKFDVIEDWPIQIGISNLTPEKKFQQIDKVFVYYRRSSGSTYLVAKSRFYCDKKEIFNFLIESEYSYLKKLLLKNRLLCFKNGNFIFSKVFNFSFFIFVFKAILSLYKLNWPNLYFDNHIKHYSYIKNRASFFVKSIN